MQDPMKNATNKLILGLDIGVASIGWCLKNEGGLVAMGVRMFSPPETGNDRRPTGREWRTNRLNRRSIRRRRQRLADFRTLFNLHVGQNGNISEFEGLPSPWDLRARGLDEALSREQWLSVLYHILRHRGPKFSKYRIANETPDSDANREEEEERRKSFANALINLNDYQKNGYRTPGEYIARGEKFKQQKRNRQGEFISLFPRSAIREEIVTLFQNQRNLLDRNIPVPEEFSIETENRILALFDRQRPALSGEDLESRVGTCTFERGEKRAPKHTPTFERFMLLSKINTLRIDDGNGERFLRPEERKAVIEAVMASKSFSVTYGKVRRIIAETGFRDGHDEKAIKAGAEKISFVQESRTIRKHGKKGTESPEEIRKEFDKKDFVSLPGRAKLAKALGDRQDLLEESDIMDEAVRLITLTKDEDLLRKKLEEHFRKAGIQEAEDLAGRLSLVSMSAFCDLSLVAIRKILPLMEEGLRYDEAAKEAGYCHYRPRVGHATQFLPPIPKPEEGKPIDSEMVNNPVVYRALNQARKVVNAIIKEFGPLSGIRIETARDIVKSGQERLRIEKEQADNRQKNEEARQENGSMTKAEQMKRRLYNEQGGKCLYTGAVIDIEDLSTAEIDHIYPRSKSMDDSYMNKVLVTAKANRDKGNTPLWEYLKREGMEKEFRTRVNALRSIPSQKRRRLLDENPDFERMTNADLSNTRYATRYFMNFINAHLLFANNGEATATNGRITSLLRRSWGLSKNRDEDDRHHALDAAVIAFSDKRMVQRMSKWFQGRETYGKGSVGPQDRPPFPAPEPYENKDAFRADLLKHRDAIVVSRAVRRLGTGAANKDTILSVRDKRGQRTDPASGTHLVKRVPLIDLQEKDLENLVGKDDPRNVKLYEEIRRYVGIPNKKERNVALSKIRRNVTSGPPVTSVKILERKGSGFPLRGGWTIDRGRTLRTDVFRKDGKFYLVPVYVSDIPTWEKTGLLPMGYVPFDEKSTVDESFEFVCSLYPKDLVKVKTKGEKGEIFGYFEGIDVSNATVKLSHPNGGAQLLRSGVKTALSIEKFSIDILGRNITLITGEKRRGLEIHSHRLSGKNSGKESPN